VNLRPPPAHSDEQESPVVEEFRRLAFEGVSDELKEPSDQEQSQAINPQPVHEDAGDKHRQGEKNRGNAEGMADAVHRISMARSVLRDPLLVSASAQHAEDDTTQSKRKNGRQICLPAVSSDRVIGPPGHLKSAALQFRWPDDPMVRCLEA